MPDVLSIVTDYLREHGFDGLCAEDCGCGLEDLAPCNNPYPDCQPAYHCATCDGYYPTRDHADHEEADHA